MARVRHSCNRPDSTPPMFRLLSAAPRWLVLLSLVYAPWAFGCTRPWTIVVLNALLGTALALWLADCAMRRRLPNVHPFASAASDFSCSRAGGCL